MSYVVFLTQSYIFVRNENLTDVPSPGDELMSTV